MPRADKSLQTATAFRIHITMFSNLSFLRLCLIIVNMINLC
jgi:hypothetical protein